MLKISSENCLKNKHILLIIIICIGALLRFWNLGNWSFWIDEVLTVLDTKDLSLSNSPINPIPYFATKFSAFISAINCHFSWVGVVNGNTGLFFALPVYYLFRLFIIWLRPYMIKK